MPDLFLSCFQQLSPFSPPWAVHGAGGGDAPIPLFICCWIWPPLLVAFRCHYHCLLNLLISLDRILPIPCLVLMCASWSCIQYSVLTDSYLLVSSGGNLSALPKPKISEALKSLPMLQSLTSLVPVKHAIPHPHWPSLPALCGNHPTRIGQWEVKIS